jgi:two-component system cell cycle sensor histidine kinase/response regulator CckA
MDVLAQQILVQMGVWLTLSFLLRQMFLKLRPEPFLAYWSLYAIAFSVYLVVAFVFQKARPAGASHQQLVLIDAIGFFLWVFQPTLMLLAGLALHARRPPRATERGILIAAASGAAIVALVLVLSGTMVPSVPLLSPLRFVIHCAALAYFAWAFSRSGHRFQAIGGKLTVLFSAAYALHMLVHGVSLLGFHIYSGLTSRVAAVIGTLLPLGMATGVVLSVIEEARDAGQEARESDRRFRALLEDIRMGAVMLDREGSVTFCNDHLARILGWRREEIVGKNWFDCFVPEPVRARTRQKFGAFMDSGFHPPQHENFVLTRDGRHRLMQWSNTPLTDKTGKMAGTSSLGHDLTEQRQLEESFRQSQKMESVGRLAGGVAHDFNNHLTVINGYCDLALARLNAPSGALSKDDQPIRHMVREVRLAGDRAATLTRQLLAFSRKQILTLAPVSCNDVVNGTLGMFRRLVREEIILHEVLAPDLGTVIADRSQLEQVLMNLVVNANDAITGAGTVTIRTSNVTLDESFAEAHPESKPGDYVMLAVADSGHGMDDATRSQIFEPFFTTKALDKGTGLGLSTVYGIIRQSGGSILVTSEPGNGARFQIFLPRVKLPGVKLPGLKAGLDQAPVEEHAHPDLNGNGSILVVEDHEQLRRMVVNVLAGFGYQVSEAISGDDAILLASTAASAPEMLITDIMMPGINGVDLAERLCSVWPRMQVLYISGYTDSALTAQAAQIAARSYLPKPFTPAQLLQRVQEMLPR